MGVILDGNVVEAYISNRVYLTDIQCIISWNWVELYMLVMFREVR